MFFKAQKKEIFILIGITILFVSPKWIISTILYDENVILKIINEIEGDGEFYLPYIKYFSEFNLNNSFDLNEKDLRSVSIPIGSLILHSIIFKVSGIYSIIISEFLIFFLYLFFINEIYKIYFKPKLSFILPILIITIPYIIIIFNLDDYFPLNIISSNFFNFRIHRPLSTTLFLFIFIFLVAKILNENFDKKKAFFIGIVLGLTFTSFYYFFIIQVITFAIILFFKYRLNIFSYLFNNYSIIFLFIIGFFLFSLPFLINIYFTESDLIQRTGMFELTREKKIIILKHYFKSFIDFKFLLFFSFNVLFFIMNIKFCKKTIYFTYIPFIIFISSILTPIIFFSLSNSASLIYHFNNNIIICSYIFLVFCFINLCENLITNKNILNKISILLLVFTILFNSSNYFQDSKNIQHRNELNEVIKTLSLENVRELSILTFDNKIIIWSILNDIKDLKIINGLISPKTNEQIENDIIESFYFLGLNSDKFLKFFENKDYDWRFFNRNTANFFYARYQANKVKLFSNIDDYENNEINKILKSSPSLNQQLIIPISEFKRLEKKFKEFKPNQDLLLPDYIILNKQKFIFNNINLKDINHCAIFNGNHYIIFSKINCN